MLIFISIFLGFFSLQIYNLIIIEKKKRKTNKYIHDNYKQILSFFFLV